MNEVQGIYRNHSVSLSVQIRVLPIMFLVLHWLTIFGIWVYHHVTMCCVLSWSDTTLNLDLKVKFIGFLTCFCDWPITFFWFDFGMPYLYHHKTVCCIHSRSRYDLELRPQGKIYRVFEMFSCPAHNYFLIWHGLTIFGTWVYHHEKMWQVHSCSQFYIDLWPQGQIYRLLSCLHVQPVTSVCFDIGTPLEDLSSTFMILIWHWPQGQIHSVYDMALCSGLSFFVLWPSHTLFGM